MSTQHSPVTCQVFKVVHDDSDEQVDNLDREKDRITTLPFTRKDRKTYLKTIKPRTFQFSNPTHSHCDFKTN